MGSQRPRMIRLSDSAPPTNYGALEDELNGRESKENEPQRLNVVGSITEKNFSLDPVPRHRISLPQPRVTPFPVARHRSHGPHWGPPASASKESSDPVIEFNGDEEGTGMSAAEMAVPLSRRKPAQSLVSKWRSGRKSDLNISSQIQTAFDDTRQRSNPQDVSEVAIEKSDHVVGQIHSAEGLKILAEEKDSNSTPSQRGQSRKRPSQKSGLEELGNDAQSDRVQKRTHDSLQMPFPMSVVENRTVLGGADSKPAEQATQSGLSAPSDLEIDAESSQALSAMSAEEVAEAQAELSQRMRPELLELLRKRGAEKERKRLADKTGASVAMNVSEGNDRPVGIPGDKEEVTEQHTSSRADDVMPAGSIQSGIKGMTLSDDQTASKRAETVRGTKVGPADLLTATTPFAQGEPPSPSNEAAEESSLAPPTTDPWTLRVEATRSMRFDLHGSVVSMAPSSPQRNEGVPANSLQNSLSVVERDYLRTEGDPVGAGYSLKEALALVRSTVPGQRAVALHLIASVLDKAIQGLQEQKPTPCGTLFGEGIGGQIDWQAIWAYALGPEAELVLTLRLALDDGHSTVVAACARAIQALLSYSANESYFDSLEGVWRGDKAVYTAPVFRRKTKHDEGFIGGGRWKYNVKTSEMFPFSDTAAQEKSEEDGKDTVADDTHVSNKDVAAGLIRMGILPRIRYLLEVDQLIAAEEALLSVVICLARHSPAAANAVMTCPRLIDAILQRFIGTDERVSQESWSSRVKAIRLLKVLSQAKGVNCAHFERIGALQTVMQPLLQQNYVKDPSGHARDRDEGYCEIMIETLRFWRVCVDYGIGIPLFTDCYSTLCFWLLPLSTEEILNGGKDQSPLLLLAKESYLLLEHFARTLPFLHDGSGERMEQASGVNWSWSVAQAMLDTAMKWLSTECISAVHMKLEQYILAREKQSHETETVQVQAQVKSSTSRVLGVVAAVLSFLATMCERIVSEKQLRFALEDPAKFSLPWLPTFLPQLGLALARSGLLLNNNSQVDPPQSDLPSSTVHEDSPVPTGQADDLLVSAMESDSGAPTLVSKEFTFVECLNFYVTEADSYCALASINCLNALVRVNSVVDSLIYIAKPQASPSLEEQTLAHKILEHGLLLSAEADWRKLLFLCKENVIRRTDLLQMSVRGGPAPGVGVGWGSFCCGAWSKEVLIAEASARLALDLMSVFSSRVWLSHSDDNEGDANIEDVKQPSQQLPFGLSSTVNFCLSVIAISSTVSRELALRACNSVIFHPSTLSILMQKNEEVLVSSRRKRALEEGFQAESRAAEDKKLDGEHQSKILLKHFENFWLTRKKRKGEEERPYNEGLSKKKGSVSGRNLLATVHEDSGEDSISHPESLMIEWVGQRLPLPSHWFLSPLVGDPLLATPKNHWEHGADSPSKKTMEVEEVIKAGLVFFLGIEVIAADVPEAAEFINAKIPLVRKIHSLSTVYVSGGDVFLDPGAQDLIGALQNLMGDQIGGQSTNLAQYGTENRRASEEFQNSSNGHTDSQVKTTSNSQSSTTEENGVLDFEGSIDASYRNYAELLAEQFVATSYGDHLFGRQVAFYLCLEVPAVIRLATWRVLADGRVLELLPPLSQCAGPPQKYLYPVEADQQMLEAFVSAWSSGALDKAAERKSLSFTLAVHHLAGYLFDTSDTEETLLLKKKTARALVRSTVRKSHRQEMLSRMIYYVPSGSASNGLRQPDEDSEARLTEKFKSRLLLLLTACEGDSALTAEVRHLEKLLVSKVQELLYSGGQ